MGFKSPTDENPYDAPVGRKDAAIENVETSFWHLSIISVLSAVLVLILSMLAALTDRSQPAAVRCQMCLFLLSIGGLICALVSGIAGHRLDDPRTVWMSLVGGFVNAFLTLVWCLALDGFVD